MGDKEKMFQWIFIWSIAGSSIGDGTVERTGKSIHGLMEIGKQFEQDNGIC